MTAAPAPGWTTAGRLRHAFLLLAAAVGLVLTWYFNLTYQGADGYLAGWFANSASSSAAVDLLVVSAAACVFLVAEARRLGMRLPLLYVLAGVLVAMAFAFPLFLAARERALAAGRGAAAGRTGVDAQPAVDARPGIGG